MHVVCVWWTPELATDPDTVRPCSLARLDPARRRLSCSACHGRGGAAVECAEPSCLEACHPFCAMRAGLLLRESDGAFELFCRTHSLRRRRRISGAEICDNGPDREGSAVEEGEKAGVGGCVAEGAAATAAAVAGCETPVVGREKGRGGTPRRGLSLSTPSTCAPTPPGLSGSKPAMLASSSAGPDRSGEPSPSCPSPSLALEGSQSSPSPTPPPRRRRRRPPADLGPAKSRRKTIAASDEDTDDDDNMGVSPCRRDDGADEPGAATTPLGSRAINKTPRRESGSGKRASGGSGKGKGSGTPLRVFDMAPPTPLPPPLHPIPAGEKDGEGSGTPSPVMRRNNGRLRGGGGGGAGTCGVGAGGVGGSDGGDEELMTLSQAVSPVEEAGKRDLKRRRLHKVTNGCVIVFSLFSLFSRGGGIWFGVLKGREGQR